MKGEKKRSLEERKKDIIIKKDPRCDWLKGHWGSLFHVVIGSKDIK